MSKSPLLFLVLLSSTFLYSTEETQKVSTRSIGTQTSDSDVDTYAALEPFCLKVDKKNSWVVVNKRCLSEDYFLRANMIQFNHFSRFAGKTSRVVNFLQKGKELLLVEKSIGHTVFSQLNPTFVIANYPIKKETKTAIAFDFEKGIKEFFTSRSWYSQEYYGSQHQSASRRYESIALKNTFLDKIFELPEIKDSVQINIKARAPVENGKTYVPTEVRYLLEPYVENPDFVPTKSEFEKNDTGYFEVEPLIDEDQNHITYATKWDISKPIVYSISANTPAEYIKPITAGILYWNRAFGREVIKVEMAPEGEEAPSYARNIVQWIHWKKAGFAYADAQADHYGWIRNAQVFLTSAFALSVKKRAQRYLFLLESNNSDDESVDDIDLTLLSPREGLLSEILKRNPFNKNDNHHHGHMCQHGLSEGFADAFSSLLSAGASEDVINDFVGKYLFIVSAHEVGHTLGLRHNFAGTLYGKLNQTEIDDNFKALSEGNDLPHNKPISSSVMDYINFKEDIILAHQMMNSEEALPYDRKAIRKLYFGEEGSVEGKDLLFCTDSHVGKYADCKRFMYGRDPFTHTERALEQNFKELPYALASHFYNHMKDSSRPNMVLRDVFKDRFFDQLALKTLHPVWDALSSMTDHASSLQSQVNYGDGINWSRFNFNRDKHLNWMLDKFQEKGKSIDKILSYENFYNQEDVAVKFMDFLENEFHADENEAEAAALKVYFEEHKEDIRQHIIMSLDRLRDHFDYIEALQMIYTFSVADELIGRHRASLSQILSNYYAYKVKSYIFSMQPIGNANKVRGVYEFRYKFPYAFNQVMSERDKIEVIQTDPKIPMPYPHAKNIADQRAREVLKLTSEKLEKLIQEQGGDSDTMMEEIIDAQKASIASVADESGSKPATLESMIGKIRLIDEDPQPTLTYTLGIPLNLLLPKFRYTNRVRFIATYLLNPYRNKSITFGSQERSSIERQFDEFLEKINPGLPINKFRLDGQDQNVAEWITFQRKLKHNLNTKESLAK